MDGWMDGWSGRWGRMYKEMDEKDGKWRLGEDETHAQRPDAYVGQSS